MPKIITSGSESGYSTFEGSQTCTDCPNHVELIKHLRGIINKQADCPNHVELIKHLRGIINKQAEDLSLFRNQQSEKEYHDTYENKPLNHELNEVNDITYSEISDLKSDEKAININKELLQTVHKTLNDERSLAFTNQNETLNLIGNTLKDMIDLSIVNDKVQKVPRLTLRIIRRKDGSGLSILSKFIKKFGKI